MKTAWVVNVNTESGDKYTYVFDHIPSDEAIEAFLYDRMSIEYEEVGFVHWSLSQQDIMTDAEISADMLQAYRNFKNRGTDV